MSFQDWKVVDIGNGSQKIDPNMQKRISQRAGQTTSIHKLQHSPMVSKSIINATEACKMDYCDGKEITRMRCKKGISQKELAHKSNQKVQIISQLEQNKLVATPENKKLYNKLKNILK